jgi:hypothetical protein
MLFQATLGQVECGQWLAAPLGVSYRFDPGLSRLGNPATLRRSRRDV